MWFSNIASSLSNAFSGVSKFVEDVYNGVKDTSSFIKKSADNVSSWLDQATNTVANIPYIGSGLATAIDEARNFAFIPGVGSLNDLYNEIKIVDKQIQNNPYEGIVNELGSLVKSGVDSFSNIAPKLDTATESVQSLFN